MLHLRFDAYETRIEGDLDQKTEHGLKESCLRWVDRNIEMQNRLNQGRYYADPVKYCYDPIKKSFPTGLLPTVTTWLEEHSIAYKTEMLYRPVMASDIPTPDWAWDHQKEIVDNVLLYRRCIVRSPTASGKTSSISFIIEKFPDHPVLVVAPSINLVNNIAADIQRNLNIPIGRIGGGNEDWQRVTVSTARSLLVHAEDPVYQKILSEVAVVIFDECHSYSNKTGQTISKLCYNSSYRAGLSATTDIESGSGRVLEGVIGPLTLVVPDTLMVDLGVIHKPDIHFIPVPDPKYSYDIPWGESKPARHEVYKRALVQYPLRNQLILEIIKEFRSAKTLKGVGGNTLVLIEHKEHGHLLSKLFQREGIAAPFVWGETNSKTRADAVAAFKAGELNLLIASRILNEGEDVPVLELVVNAGGGSGKRGIIQKTGRALRKDATHRKNRAVIVGFYDNEPYYLQSNSWKRMKNINDRHPNCARLSSLSELYAVFHN